MSDRSALAACYERASRRGHALDLVGATADVRGTLTCVGCGATDELFAHLLEVAADAFVEEGLLPGGARAELPGHPLLMTGTLAELLAALGGPENGHVPHIDVVADLNFEADEPGVILARVPTAGALAVGTVLIAGTPTAWSPARVEVIEDGGWLRLRLLSTGKDR